MCEVGYRDGFAADLTRKLAHFLMWALQELIEDAKFVHHFKS